MAGHSMREHEVYSKLRAPPSSRMILRLDGRGFHRLTESLDFDRPYDEAFRDLMIRTCLDLMDEFSPSLIYTFSDEINVLLDSVPFAGRVEKLDSVFSGFASSSFTRGALEAGFSPVKPVSFDCRVIPISSDIVPEYFRSRQDESWRNCLNSYAYWTLRREVGARRAAERLRGLKSDSLHDLLFERGVNISRVPAWQRRGVGVYRVPHRVRGYNPLRDEEVSAVRMRVKVDLELPLFTDEFFEGLMR